MSYEEVFADAEPVKESKFNLEDSLRDFFTKNPEKAVIFASVVAGALTYLSIRGLIASGVHAGNLRTYKYLCRHPELMYRVL